MGICRHHRAGDDVGPAYRTSIDLALDFAGFPVQGTSKGPACDSSCVYAEYVLLALSIHSGTSSCLIQ